MSVGVLLSYHYFGDRPIEDTCGDWRPLLFADSGAFSAATQGAEIDLDAYAAWLDANRERIDVACTLDVIGDADATAENTRRLEDHGHLVMPVFHVGEPWEWLHRWCESYKYVGIGGMVPHAKTPEKLLRWVVQAMTIAQPYGTVFHGLGLTSFPALRQLPLFSVDSSAWSAFKRFGNLVLWDPMRGWTSIEIGSEKAIRANTDLLRAYGLTPSLMTASGYGRLLDRADVAAYRAERELMGEASVRSWARFHDWWHDRFAPIEVPGLDPGPHVFLACVDNTIDVASVRAALTLENLDA